VVKALRELAKSAPSHQSIPRLPLPGMSHQLYLPRDVFFSRRRRRLPVKDAIGLPSAETIATYPPGCAIVVAGEKITQDIVEFLQETRAHGGVLKGASDPDFSTISVLE